jgi:hypothetical protein
VTETVPSRPTLGRDILTAARPVVDEDSSNGRPSPRRRLRPPENDVASLVLQAGVTVTLRRAEVSLCRPRLGAVVRHQGTH